MPAAGLGWCATRSVGGRPPSLARRARRHGGADQRSRPGNVEIVEKDLSPGTSQVRIQVIRPADACGERLTVRETSVLVTWTTPSLGIRQAGPPTAAIGETVTYRIEVSNPGDLPARDIVATEEVPKGLNFLQANPVPVIEGRRLQWRLGDLAPRQQQIIEATFAPCHTASSAIVWKSAGRGGLRSSNCYDNPRSWPPCPDQPRYPPSQRRGPGGPRQDPPIAEAGASRRPLRTWRSRSRRRARPSSARI